MKPLVITIVLLGIVIGLNIIAIIAQIKKDKFINENHSLSEDNKSNE